MRVVLGPNEFTTVCFSQTYGVKDINSLLGRGKKKYTSCFLLTWLN